MHRSSDRLHASQFWFTFCCFRSKNQNLYKQKQKKQNKPHTCEVGGAQPSNGAIFALLPHFWPKKSKSSKNEKNAMGYHGFALV